MLENAIAEHKIERLVVEWETVEVCLEEEEVTAPDVVLAICVHRGGHVNAHHRRTRPQHDLGEPTGSRTHFEHTLSAELAWLPLRELPETFRRERKA